MRAAETVHGDGRHCLEVKSLVLLTWFHRRTRHMLMPRFESTAACRYTGGKHEALNSGSLPPVGSLTHVCDGRLSRHATENPAADFCFPAARA